MRPHRLPSSKLTVLSTCFLLCALAGGSTIAQDQFAPASAPDLGAKIPQNPALRLVAIIPMPQMTGTWDHLAADAKTARLFLSAQDEHMVDVVDLRTNRPFIRMVGNFNRPQGEFYVPGLDKLVVTNGRDGTAKIFSGTSYELLNTIQLGMGADMIEFDPKSKYLYVEYGGKDSNRGPGKLAIIDATNGNPVGNIETDFRSAAMAIESSRPRLYVELPGANQVAVIDTATRQIAARFDLPGRPAAITLDEANHRLFVTTRTLPGNPAQPMFLVLDTESGKVIAQLDSTDGTESMFYDKAHHRVYASTLDGYLQAYQEIDPDHYKTIAKIATSPHAGTSQFIPEINRLCVAISPHDKQPSEVWVLEPLP